MFRTALLAAAILWPTHALAQSVPPEVMEHYRTYAAEMKKAEPDRTTLGDSARDAWMTAEDTLGDHKLTGDLAVNFAETRHATVDGEWTPEVREDAYRRAVELADLYPEEERDDVRAQRQILLAQFLINDGRYDANHTSKARRVLKDLGERMDELGWSNRTYHGDMHTLIAQSRLLDRRYKKVLEHTELARAAFERADDGLFSVQLYQLPLFEAVAAQKLGQDVRAGKSLQKLVEDHHKYIGSYTGPSAVAYSQWLDLRDELQVRADEAEVATLLAWTPPPAIGSDEPAVRTPPIMPPSATRSGWVQFEFDILPNGRVDMDTVEVLDRTDTVFIDPSRDALKMWVYPPGMAEDDRKALTTVITYQLSDERGKLIPSPKPKPEE